MLTQNSTINSKYLYLLCLGYFSDIKAWLGGDCYYEHFVAIGLLCICWYGARWERFFAFSIDNQVIWILFFLIVSQNSCPFSSYQKDVAFLEFLFLDIRWVLVAWSEIPIGSKIISSRYGWLSIYNSHYLLLGNALFFVLVSSYDVFFSRLLIMESLWMFLRRLRMVLRGFLRRTQK
jgi:hypothetical protein